MTANPNLKIVSFDADLADEPCDCLHPQAVRHSKMHLEDEAAILNAADLFSLLGDTTRLRVLVSLLHGELCVTDIAAATEVNRTTISHQLRVLRSTNLVSRRRDGKVVYYSITSGTLTELLELVAPGVCTIDTEIAR